MKKILLLSVMAMSFLSANVDNSKKVDAIEAHAIYLQEQTKIRADRIYIQAHKTVQKQKGEITLGILMSNLKRLETINPDCKNDLNADEQLQFVALLNILATIK